MLWACVCPSVCHKTARCLVLLSIQDRCWNLGLFKVHPSGVFRYNWKFWGSLCLQCLCLQCFVTVGWVAGRASWLVGCWHGYLSGWGADLHMTQLIPLSLTVSCFSKIQIGFTFLVPAYPGSPGQDPESHKMAKATHFKFSMHIQKLSGHSYISLRHIARSSLR